MQMIAKQASTKCDVYQAFGFPKPQVFLATRPEKKVGSDELWDKAEAALRQVDQPQHTSTAADQEFAVAGRASNAVLQSAPRHTASCAALRTKYWQAQRGALFLTHGSSLRCIRIRRS